MQYHDFTITINEFQGAGYPVTALAEELGRVATALPAPDEKLRAHLAEVAELQVRGDGEAALAAAGSALFRWLTPEPVETHLRLAWDRAQRNGRGLRLRLTIDSPEISAWPWELLRDPEREHLFALSPATPLVRYFDQANRLGALAEQAAALPLSLLLVLPQTADLDLAAERRSIEEVASSLTTALRVRTLAGLVTRTDLADALLTGDYDIIHFGGHGAFVDGRGYIGLNQPDGTADWIHSGTLSRLAVNYRAVKLVIMNACNSGKLEDGRGFQGLAPQMVRFGVPAVVAMQYPITDAAAHTFAREFYKRLCLGDGAGQVDVALTYARGMVSVLHADEDARGWAAPVLYTHAADGVIYRLPQAESQPTAGHAQLQALTGSLQTSLGINDDWALADPGVLATWRQTLLDAEAAYRTHLDDRQPEAQAAARKGLAVIQRRLAAMQHEPPK